MSPEPLPQHTDHDARRYHAPTDDKYTGGTFTQNSTGEEFSLAMHEPDIQGYTHSLKNTLHTWQGTREQFEAEFTQA